MSRRAGRVVAGALALLGGSTARATDPLDCARRDPVVCAAVNGLVPRIHARLPAPLLVETSPRAELRPSAVYEVLAEVAGAAGGAGCAIDGFGGGVYAFGPGEGAWEGELVRAGRSRLASGSHPGGTGWSGASADGAPIGDRAGARSAGGQLAANLGENGFLAGVWARRVGERGVFAALTGTCPPGVDAGLALDGWYDDDLPAFEPPIRFIAFGDSGDGSLGQLAVARAIKGVCQELRCDFALHLGDNIYDVGVTSVDDPQFQSKFERPYAALDFPFHMALGNHDYGNGYDTSRPPFQVAYTGRSAKWSMPAAFYAFRVGDVQFVALDTTAIQHGDGAAQVDLAREALLEPATWRVAFGHHPYVSNGRHGDAGAYDGATAPIPRGELVKGFVEDELCGKFDLYLAGHDHDRQWLGEVCGTEMIVSGAGAKLRSLIGVNPTLWESATLGFLYAVIDRDTFTGSFYGVDGKIDFERSFTRRLPASPP